MRRADSAMNAAGFSLYSAKVGRPIWRRIDATVRRVSRVCLAMSPIRS
jgi:hypothetical protein